jgi:hypothetical protein
MLTHNLVTKISEYNGVPFQTYGIGLVPNLVLGTSPFGFFVLNNNDFLSMGSGFYYVLFYEENFNDLTEDELNWLTFKTGVV